MKNVNIPKAVLILISIVLVVFSNSVELMLLAFIFYFLYFKNKEYKNSSYYQITHYPQSLVQFNKGRYGEYLIYKYLKGHEINGAMFLFNVYVPKENGETSEIDVIMIHHKGIFVFESKNYSGWIFGSETQRMWTQTLPKGRKRSHKESFYNPIMQNKTHIKNLEEYVGRALPAKSIIVFSERCTLKKVQVESSNIYVINRNHVIKVVNDICDSIQKEILSTDEIYEIYNCLYPLTQTDEETKKQHINNIRGGGKTHKEKNSVRKDNIVMFPQKQPSELIRNETTSAQVEASNADTQTIASSKLDIAEASKMIKKERPLKCPRCGGDLILRTAKKGVNVGQQFYGCSNYPKCRYVRNI